MILVTGATGLVGSHIALRLLEHGERVCATYREEVGISTVERLFDLRGKSELFKKIDWIKADITDIPALEMAFAKVDRVYHCAALISFDPNDEEKLRKINIEGTANIVNCCLAFGVQKLCYVSSMAALGDLREGEHTITEETEWNPEKPHNDYGISKYGAEMEVWRGLQEGLDVVVINPGIIIGPPLWKTGSSKLFDLVRHNHPFFTNGSMGFIAVEDVAEIAVWLMDSEISGERFSIFSEILSYRDVFYMTADAMQKRRPHFEAKPWMLQIGWRLDWIRANVFGRKRILSKDDARSLFLTENYSNAKIMAVLDHEFKDIRMAIEEAVELTRDVNF